MYNPYAAIQQVQEKAGVTPAKESNPLSLKYLAQFPIVRAFASQIKKIVTGNAVILLNAPQPIFEVVAANKPIVKLRSLVNKLKRRKHSTPVVFRLITQIVKHIATNIPPKVAVTLSIFPIYPCHGSLL